MPKQSPKKKMPKWLRWLAIIVGSILGLVLILALIGWLTFCKLRDAWTLKEREPLPEVVVSKEDVNRLTPTYKKIKQAFSGKVKGETTVVLESDDLDKFVSVANEGRHVKEVARFRIEGDKVIVKTDVNLDRFPLFKGRYLSGDFSWDVSMDEKAWHFHLDSVKVKENNMPDWILKRINKKINSKEEILRTQLAPEWAQRVKSLTVKDGKLTVVIK